MRRKLYEPDDYYVWYINTHPLECKENSDGLKVSVATFTLQVTDGCNLACTYCYETEKRGRRMSFETAKKAIDLLLDEDSDVGQYFKDVPSIILDFIGGEPFLEIELMDKVVDYFRKQAILKNHRFATEYMVSVCSNGILYDDERVKRFLNKNIRHLSFSISIDGTKKLHDSCRIFPDGSPSYDIAHTAAMDWIDHGQYMGSKMTWAPQNISYIQEAMLQMMNDGYTKIHSNCVFENVWKEEDATTIYYESKKFSDWMDLHKDKKDYKLSFYDEYNGGHPLKESNNTNWCGANKGMLAVDPDGIIYPCVRFTECSNTNHCTPFVLGNVHDGMFRNDEEKKRRDELKRLDRKIQSTKECFYCPIASTCAHCTGLNYIETGTINKKVTYYCVTQKARTLATVYYWNNYYKKNNIDRVMDLWVPRQWAVPIIGEKEYDFLVSLTKSLGGYVNEKEEYVTVTESHDCFKGHEECIVLKENEKY